MRPLCATLLSALALSSAAASEPTIVVEGNRRIDAQAIREHFHASSDGLTPAAIDAALNFIGPAYLMTSISRGPARA
jgi:outer membrane protein insertion porin family